MEGGHLEKGLKMRRGQKGPQPNQLGGRRSKGQNQGEGGHVVSAKRGSLSFAKNLELLRVVNVPDMFGCVVRATAKVLIKG